MTDTTDVKLFAVNRHAPSKGFDVAIFPGAPFGPEVVLSLREREEAEVAVEVKVVTDPEVLKDRPPFMEVSVGAVTVLIDLATAEEIASVLRFHEMDERHEEEVGQ